MHVPAQLLLINPNTSHSVTQRLSAYLGGALPQLEIHACTAAFGASYIADERSFCIAGHAVIDAWEQAMACAPAPGYNAVLVGCFGDPGLHALREMAHIPVLGLAESAIAQLHAQGLERVAIVTGGQAWQTMLQRWSRAAGHDRADARPYITDIQVLPANGLQMMQSPQAAADALAQACVHAMQDGQAQAVLLGGAGLAGMGEQVRQRTQLAVWDCVELVAQQLQGMQLQPVASL